MIIPPFLSAGDTVGLVAPAKRVSAHMVQIAEEHLESWGLRTKRGKHLLNESHSYFSGTDDERLSDLQHFVDDPRIKAILCARGAYGTTRIVDRLDLKALIDHPKWIAGFSDITSLHLALFKEGIVSLQSTMPVNFEDPAYASSVESMKNALLGNPSLLTFNSDYNRPGVATAPVIGGNLSLFLDSMGTRHEARMEGCILVIEETDEYMHKVDRMLNQLRRSGKLDHLAGLLVGHMTRITDNDPSFGETVEAIVLHHVAHASFPVAFGFPTGHQPPNMAWYHGMPATLETIPGQATLTFRLS